MTDEQLLGRNCQICGICRNTLKFAEVAQIRELGPMRMRAKNLQPH